MEMNRLKKGLMLAAMGVFLIAGTTLANPGMSGMGANTPHPFAEADREAFAQLWEKAISLAAFTPEQIKRLIPELEDVQRTLAASFDELKMLRQDRLKAAFGQTEALDKRIALKEAERDLLVSKIELALKGYLSADQVNLIGMAAFHGISESYSDGHRQQTHGGMNMQMNELEQAAMDLADLAEKLNQDGRAVSLEIAIAILKGHMPM